MSKFSFSDIFRLTKMAKLITLVRGLTSTMFVGDSTYTHKKYSIYSQYMLVLSYSSVLNRRGPRLICSFLDFFRLTKLQKYSPGRCGVTLQGTITSSINLYVYVFLSFPKREHFSVQKTNFESLFKYHDSYFLRFRIVATLLCLGLLRALIARLSNKLQSVMIA